MPSTSEKLNLITRNTVEVLTEKDFKEFLENGVPMRGYIGVEPSGLFHIGWTVWASKVKDLMQAGVDMSILWATWHAWINDKLGGKLENINKCASYLQHCLKAIDIDVVKLKQIRAEEMVSDPDYWATVLKVGKNTTLARIKRALTIIGRVSSEAAIDPSKLIYPLMQVSDIFYLDLNVCLGGLDQRKAHVLAREVYKKIDKPKPAAVHMPLLIGLQGGEKATTKAKVERLMEIKMSKSKPERCIFIHDTEEEVKQKIASAFCPPKQVEDNPVIELNRLCLFPTEKFVLKVDRPASSGGAIEFHKFSDLEKAYREGSVHPLDLKNATTGALNKRLEPVRAYFEKTPEAKRLYEEVKKLAITR
jgi:tyrosyl-tRNA synthetase